MFPRWGPGGGGTGWEYLRTPPHTPPPPRCLFPARRGIFFCFPTGPGLSRPTEESFQILHGRSKSILGFSVKKKKKQQEEKFISKGWD